VAYETYSDDEGSIMLIIDEYIANVVLAGGTTSGFTYRIMGGNPNVNALKMMAQVNALMRREIKKWDDEQT
jgi:hypothetical protein